MTSEELLNKVRKIEIKTRGLSKNIFAGEYHSQFKGRGMAFSEVREYQPGDDVRSIDWNVTARLNRPYIKVFEEERELTVMLLVDVSGSRNFGTLTQFKRDMMAEVAATLAFSTIENNDKVGVIFFSDKISTSPRRKARRTFCTSFANCSPSNRHLHARTSPALCSILPTRKNADAPPS